MACVASIGMKAELVEFDRLLFYLHLGVLRDVGNQMGFCFVGVCTFAG